MQAKRSYLPARAILFVALAAAAAVAFAACGDDDDPGAGTPTGAAAASTPATTGASDQADEWSGRVFFPAADLDRLVARQAPASSGVDPLQAALAALVQGPGEEGLAEALPDGVRVLSAAADAGIAAVDLSAEFEAGYPSGGSAAEVAALAPLVFTVTEVPGVEAVRLTVEGRIPDLTTQFDLTAPLSRQDFPSGLVEGG